MAKDNGWGLGRILGEFKKLGIRKISKSTVRNILKEHGFDPGPKRGKGTWDDFIRIHTHTLWSCDFFSKKVWTLGGLVEYFVLFFVQPGTRKVHIAGMTANPDGAWMAQQARNVCMFFDELPEPPRYLISDRDTKFTKQFQDILKSGGVEVVQVAVRAPNQNAHAERFAQTIQQECLDHFIVFGERHLRYLIREFVRYYHDCRPHQSLGNLPPSMEKPPEEFAVLGPNDVVRREWLGGLLADYERSAA